MLNIHAIKGEYCIFENDTSSLAFAYMLWGKSEFPII